MFVYMFARVRACVGVLMGVRFVFVCVRVWYVYMREVERDS